MRFWPVASSDKEADLRTWYRLVGGRGFQRIIPLSLKSLYVVAACRPPIPPLGMLLANQDTELTQDHSGRKALL